MITGLSGLAGHGGEQEDGVILGSNGVAVVRECLAIPGPGTPEAADRAGSCPTPTRAPQGGS